MSSLISIVIPVYNGEVYLEKTITSLKNQSYTNFEIIFVDDSSTDGSLEILRASEISDSRIKVYQKPNGGTAAKAVNFGLKYATGDYFMYSSQDDLYSNDLLEKSINAATKLNLDAVVPDMFLLHGESKFGNKTIGINGDRSQIISGREALILSLDWTIHGFVLWDMSIVKRIGFYEFGINSDEFTTRVLYLNSKRVGFSEGIFYYRQNNTSAITKKWSINQLECFDTSERLEEYLFENKFRKEEIAKVRNIILVDLIRIEMMFLNQKAKLSPQQRGSANREIRDIYQRNQHKIKDLKYTIFKHQLIKSMVSTNYFCFVLFSYLYNKFLRISNGQ